jgi:hypothetical protein
MLLFSESNAVGFRISNAAKNGTPSCISICNVNDMKLEIVKSMLTLKEYQNKFTWITFMLAKQLDYLDDLMNIRLVGVVEILHK